VYRAAAGADDPDIAVFRFTLGIPGFDDALIPRVAGALGAALLVINHLLADGDPSAAQGRAELLGAALAGVAVATPALEARLLEAQPGRGRQAAAGEVQGSSNVFALGEGLGEAAKRELAWASYALLRNANVCALAVVWQGQAVMCRGLVGAQVAAGGGAVSLGAATSAWQQQQQQLGGTALYCPDRGDIAQQGLDGCAIVPAGARSLLVQPLQPFSLEGEAGGDPRGALLLISERERALSAKERAWAAALAAKLHAVLSLA
jgi:hypothetical protein